MMCSLGWILFILTAAGGGYLVAKLWKHRATIRELLRDDED